MASQGFNLPHFFWDISSACSPPPPLSNTRRSRLFNADFYSLEPPWVPFFLVAGLSPPSLCTSPLDSTVPSFFLPFSRLPGHASLFTLHRGRDRSLSCGFPSFRIFPSHLPIAFFIRKCQSHPPYFEVALKLPFFSQFCFPLPVFFARIGSVLFFF